MAAVSKEDYLAWEKGVIKAFFEPDQRSTALVPTDGACSVLLKEKYILVADALTKDGVCLSRRAEKASSADTLPTKTKIQLWHIGKQAIDGVNLGVADEQVNHPACDLGGLTNLRQKIGSVADFVDGEDGGVSWPLASMSAKTLSTLLHALWCKLSTKSLPEALKEDLQKWLGSVADALPDGAILRFHKLPSEHRVMVTPSDVRRATGKYYVRVFGGDSFAKESDGSGLYCGVTEKFITPNINLNNISLEYLQYGNTGGDKQRESRELNLFSLLPWAVVAVAITAAILMPRD